MKKLWDRRHRSQNLSDVEANVDLDRLAFGDSPFGADALESGAMAGISNYSTNSMTSGSTPAIGPVASVGALQLGGPFSSNPTHPLGRGLVSAMDRSRQHFMRLGECVEVYEARLHREIRGETTGKNDGLLI